MNREIGKIVQEQMKSKGKLSEHLNRQFLSPTNSEEGNLSSLKKGGSKKMDFSLDDIGISDENLKEMEDNEIVDDAEFGF